MDELNPFGVVLRKLMHSRGLDAAELAERVREMSGAAITEEDIEALMTAERGEEFRRLMNNAGDVFPREN